MMSFSSRLCLLLSFVLFASCVDPADPVPVHQYRFSGTLNVDGRTRTYVLQLPPGYYNTSEGVPLVIALHGTGGTGAQFEYDYRFSEKAAGAGFAVVYPDGIKSDGFLGIRTWNAGGCCDYAMEQQVDDVGFINTLLDRLTAGYRFDSRRVYAAGMSNGGMMAYRLACELPHRITAIAAVSCSMMVNGDCTPSRAVPVLHIHSVLDNKIPYYGGTGIGGYYFPPVDSVLSNWALKNGCTAAPQVLEDNGRYRLTEWSSCADGTVVRCYLTQDGGHAWPGGIKSRPRADEPSSALDANDVIWEFFQRFSLP